MLSAKEFRSFFFANTFHAKLSLHPWCLPFTVSSSHFLPIARLHPCLYPFPPNSTTPFLPYHTSFKLMERCSEISPNHVVLHKRLFFPISAHRNKNKNAPLLIGYSVNDISVIPVHTAGSCYRNVSSAAAQVVAIGTVHHTRSPIDR